MVVPFCFCENYYKLVAGVPLLPENWPSIGHSHGTRLVDWAGGQNGGCGLHAMCGKIGVALRTHRPATGMGIFRNDLRSHHE